MADQRSERSDAISPQPDHATSPPSSKMPVGRIKDGTRIVWFLLLSAALNGAGAVSGYWWKFPEPVTTPENAIELTAIDTNDAPPLLQPDAPETPPDPEPTPPPEPEPTPPPLDKPPEFEIPEPTPTPTPPPKPAQTAKPKPTPAKTEEKKPAPSTGVAHGPNPPNASPNGVVGGTGHPGARSGRLLRSPSPPYPPQALQMHIAGDVRVTIQVQGGNIVSASPSSGPPMLSSAAARWVRSNWKFAPDQTGTFTLPVTFVIH